MTQLMNLQLTVISIMFFCGVTIGLIDDTKNAICNTIKDKRLVLIKGLIKITVFAVEGLVISAYLYNCSYGKISVTAFLSFIIGLWLWKKKIYGKIKD